MSECRGKIYATLPTGPPPPDTPENIWIGGLDGETTIVLDPDERPLWIIYGYDDHEQVCLVVALDWAGDAPRVIDVWFWHRATDRRWHFPAADRARVRLAVARPAEKRV